MTKCRIKTGFPEIIVAVISAGVMGLFLGMIPFTQSQRITSVIVILFHMGWLIKLATWRIEESSVHRFRKGSAIAWMVGLGWDFIGACIGAPMGVEVAGSEMGDMLGCAVIVGFQGAVLGLLIGGILAFLVVGFFWFVARPIVSRLPLSVAGFLTGMLVGGSLLPLLSIRIVSLPSGREYIVHVILLPAIVCAAYGSLAGRAGCRISPDTLGTDRS